MLAMYAKERRAGGCRRQFGKGTDIKAANGVIYTCVVQSFNLSQLCQRAGYRDNFLEIALSLTRLQPE